MKFAAALLAVFGSAAAFAPSTSSTKSSALMASIAKDMPGALSPMGFFDPLGFASRADEAEIRRYRESEVTHGRLAMLAAAGFMAQELVDGKGILEHLS
jgi:hypothetical protein